MRFVVAELPVREALGRARSRFEQADRQLARALADADAALPWLALGGVVMAAGFLGLSGIYSVPDDATPFMGAALAFGGACIGYGLPVWLRALGRHRRHLREWHGALELVQLREQQIREDPVGTVEVLNRVDEQHPLNLSVWKSGLTAAAGRYVQ